MVQRCHKSPKHHHYYSQVYFVCKQMRMYDINTNRQNYILYTDNKAITTGKYTCIYTCDTYFICKSSKLNCTKVCNCIGHKRTRCGECIGCTSSNCGSCKHCLDNPKFDGAGRLKRYALNVNVQRCKMFPSKTSAKTMNQVYSYI